MTANITLILKKNKADLHYLTSSFSTNLQNQKSVIVT